MHWATGTNLRWLLHKLPPAMKAYVERFKTVLTPAMRRYGIELVGLWQALASNDFIDLWEVPQYADLDRLSLAAASTPVTGPGLSVTVTDPGLGPNLSDVSKQRVAGSRQIILDRDLQLVVNSLWASGAEAISVGGVRIGPNVTIRQAGGAILVDNNPISSPYTVLAVGPPHSMQDVFGSSPGLRRLRLLEASYGVGVDVSARDGLTLPAGAVRDVKFAKKIGS